MVGEFFILLMFFGQPMELKEFTVRESLSECLATKRKIERNMNMDNNYKGSVRWACKKMKVEIDDDRNIVAFVEE